ncbi:MAG: uracil-DNA glycosylase [Longimicrobiales bacterium]
MRSLPALFAEMACCTRCELARGRTRVVPGVGPVPADLMLIGEAPGAREDREGQPFVGAAGRLLDGLLEHAGLERPDVFITNIVACRPPGNRTPRAKEAAAHAPWLEAQIRLVRPRALCALGRIALTYFLPKAKITELRGRPLGIERDSVTLPLLATFHPAAALRRRELLPLLEQDFAALAELLAR